MQLLIEPDEKEAFRSLWSDFPTRLPEFNQADTIPLAVGLLKRIMSLYDSKVFTPQDISTWVVRATIETEVVAVLEDDSAAPSAAVAVVTQGDATHNHKVRVTLPATRWGGSWTFTSATVESGVIGYDEDAAAVEDILEAVSTIGAGNVTVERESDDTYLIAYKGTKALTAITGIAVNGDALEVLSLKSGTMDLRTAGIAALFGEDETTKVVALTILGTPAAGTEQVLLRRDVVLNAFLGEYEEGQPIAIKGTIYDPDIDALTGTDNALETVPTVALAVGTRIQFVIDQSEQSWVLYAGAAGAGEVAPLDYDVTTNNKKFVKVGGN